ncbi:hypothetical protein [Mycolicibacterium sarraceniae]|uniref:Uncharacterized protein n=1 Tax=Mycolicibacterium sarraceniae TaxID=1534348 RepID=A0A7I7SJ82_9MYCO|nr:hypothetical protein [Mycolicibacterium sarraceniae]BBY57007.1 hypothetical protein MSAR_01430 [Mycolicibacterium sarraceniae]
MSGEVSRQAFVRRALGGLAGAALLASCRSVTPNAVSSPSPPDWNTLGTRLDGTLVMPSSANYAAAKGVFNSRFNGSTPAAVIAVASVADVQKVIAFAARTTSESAPAAAATRTSVPLPSTPRW